jgi:hypothetical protein
MKPIRLLQLLCASLSCAVLCAACAGTPENAGEAQLVNAARGWLELMDDQRYQDAWDRAAAHFKAANSPEAFLRFGVGVRRPLGQRASREVWQQDFRAQMRGRPDGQYFIVSFHTTFGNAGTSVFEHVVLEHEAQGWRVAGYSFRGAGAHHFGAFEQATPAQVFDTVRAIEPAAVEFNR